MLWTNKIALLMVLASTGTTGMERAMSRPGSHVSGLPGFFVEAAGRQGGYVAHTPGMQVILDQGGVQMISAAGPLGLRFQGANPRPAIEGCETAPGRINVLHGSAEAWETDLAAFLCVRYRNLYPGVDLVYRIEGSRVKAEFIVAAGAEPSSIRLRYSRTGRIAVDDAGDLVIATDSGEYRESAPYVYQQSGLARKAVPGRYRVSREEGMAGFDIGAYDRTIPLVIDPTISFSTYFGGSGFDAANAIAVDRTGNIYIAGWTESYDLPLLGAAQANKAGGVDAFVAKLDPTGSHILYCTYLGGSGEDRALGIALDSGGNAYITGWTNSTDFPVAGSVVQSRSGGGRDAFVTKIDNSGRLVYSTFLGGNGQDTGTGIAVDPPGNAYISGSTTSTNFPLYHPAQSSSGGQQDAFVAKLNNTGTALLFGTYLGGMGNETGNAIAVDNAGSVYIAGDTNSPNFPTLIALQPASGGNQDAFVAKLNPATGSLIYSTYLGGRGGTVGLPESATAIDVDSSGSAYVTGVTSSSNFPVATAFRSTLNGFTDAFLVKFTPSGNALVYGTYLGGSSAEVATGVRADPSGKACVAGYTASQDFPTSSPLQPSNAGAYDAFLSCFTAAGSGLTFSTYLGGSGSDAGYGMALHGSSVYLAGQSTSGDFPLKGAVQTFNGGSYSAFITIVQIAAPTAHLLAQDDATLTVTDWAMSGALQLLTTPLSGGLALPGRHVAASSLDGLFVLWQSDTSGLATYWDLLDNHSLGFSGVAGDGGVDWRVVAAADFNGDGQPDLVWQNQSTRAVAVWFMNYTTGGATMQSRMDLSGPQPQWKVVGAARAQTGAVGNIELLWQNDATGAVSMWQMGGPSNSELASWAIVSAGFGPDWRVAGLRDMDQDGHPDIVWQMQSTRDITIWYMNGNTMLRWEYSKPSSTPGAHVIAR